MPTIFTHCDSFHIDELMAISLLARFHFNVPVSELNIVRTRDPATLDSALKSNSFVIDVGRCYDAENLNFDHHQNDASLIWKEECPLSSCGLIFKWLKQQGNLSALTEHTISKLEELAFDVDQHDNGKKLWPDAKFFTRYNQSSEGDSEDRQFRKALQVAEGYLDNVIYHEENDSVIVPIIKKAVKESIENGHEDFLIVHNPLPGGRTLAITMSKAKLYLAGYKVEGKKHMEWSVKSIPSDVDKPFSSRQNMPKAWCGVEGQALKDISGFNLRFCHKGGFICVLEGTEQEAKELAKTIINIEKAE